jgi:hypothetical protein
MQIEDGMGSGYRLRVNDHNMARVYAMVESEISHMSENHGKSFSWQHYYNYAAGDTILWLRNDSQTENLIIDEFVFCSDAVTQIIVHFPEDTTQAGTAVTGVNMNRKSGNVAAATAIGDETGNTQGEILGSAFIPANMAANFKLQGAVVLGYLDEVAVDFVTVGTMGIANFRGYYHNPDE